MPKDFGSIDFGKLFERLTNDVVEAIQDLPEEEKDALLAKWKRACQKRENQSEECRYDQWSATINSHGKLVLTGCGGDDVNVIFPDDIDGESYEISGVAFRSQRIESITISKGVSLIDRLAFAHCDKLKKVMFADDFSGTIMSSAFFDCKSLEEFAFPSNTIIIEPIVNRCQRLETIYIPNSVSEIRGYAFAENVSLKNIYFDGTRDQWKAINKGYRWSDEMGDYTVHCQDGKIVTRKKVHKPIQSPQTSKCIVETQISPEEENTEYIYCEVEFEGVSRKYSYMTEDESINEGDKVVVPFGSRNLEAIGVVANIIRCTGKNAPYPPSKTKSIMRKYDT